MGNREYVIRFDFIYEEDMKIILSKLSFYNEIKTRYNPVNNMYSIYIGVDSKNEADKIAKIVNNYFKSIQA